MTQRILFVLVAILLCSANGYTFSNSIFSDSSDTKEAQQFIGATVNGHFIQGSIITSGEYYNFSQELLAMWAKKDSARLKSLLTQSTIDMYTAAGEANTLELWATAMTVHLLKCNRENPKIVITLIDGLPDNQIYNTKAMVYLYGDNSCRLDPIFL